MTKDARVDAARRALAEAIAQAIEDDVCEPAENCKDRFCPDCIRHTQAKRDAAMARRLGGVQ